MQILCNGAYVTAAFPFINNAQHYKRTFRPRLSPRPRTPPGPGPQNCSTITEQIHQSKINYCNSIFEFLHSNISLSEHKQTGTISHFRNVFKLMDVSSPKSLVISHFIHLLLSTWFLSLVSTLHILVVARSVKLWQALRSSVCLKFE